jgi:hypothetical protein
MIDHRTDAPRVLVIGIDPSAVAHLGIDADVVGAALEREQARFAEAGILSDLCLVGLEPTSATKQIAEQLGKQSYACVVIGGGIRKPEPMLEFFEQVVNIVRRYAPTAALAFNTNGANSVEAALRWLPLRAGE